LWYPKMLHDLVAASQNTVRTRDDSSYNDPASGSIRPSLGLFCALSPGSGFRSVRVVSYTAEPGGDPAGRSHTGRPTRTSTIGREAHRHPPRDPGRRRRDNPGASLQTGRN